MHRTRHISRAGGYVLAFVAIGIASLVFFPLRAVVAAPVVMLLFVPIIVTIARVSSTRASATAAILAFLFLDLIYIPPYYRLTIASWPEWVGLMVFLAVALISGQQTGRLREREQAAVRRQSELELLNRLSFRLASEFSLQATMEYIAEQVAQVVSARRVALYVNTPDGTARCVASSGSGSRAVEETALVDWVLGTSKAIASQETIGDPLTRPVAVAPAEALPGIVADATYLPLMTVDGLEGVLVAQPDATQGFSDEDVRLLVSAANLTASALERERLAEEAAHGQALRESDHLKSTLVSSVSHELKTPLAAAVARVTGLIEEEATDARVRDELTVVAEDLGRLDASIGDLLDLSRLESDAWRPRLVAEDISDVLGTALSRLPRAMAERVRFDLEPELPPVNVDFAQMVRALVNLMENALIYSPVDSVVDVTARAEGECVLVAVEDRGPGVPDTEKSRVFEKFFRGAASASAPAGTGLGLAIASEVVRSHQGSLAVEDSTPTGARFVLSLPIAGAEQ